MIQAGHDLTHDGYTAYHMLHGKQLLKTNVF